MEGRKTTKGINYKINRKSPQRFKIDKAARAQFVKERAYLKTENTNNTKLITQTISSFN